MTSPRIPMACRTLVSLFCVMVVNWPVRLDAQPLTEGDVIRLARTNDAQAGVARASVGVSEARKIEAGLYPNPSLGWQREHLTSAEPQETEDEFSLTVPIDLSGRRAAQRALARAEIGSARASVARIESEGITRAVLVFYSAVAADLRVEVARRKFDRLQEAVRVVARRQEEGTASGYERIRLELEAELAESALHELQTQASVARAELGSLLALQLESLKLKGTLDSRLPAPARLREGAPSSRPSLRLSRAAASQANAAASHARSSWVPSLSVTGGLKLQHVADTSFGYVLGLGLELPLFSRGQELRAQAAAERRLALARARALEREAELAFTKAALQWRLASAELRRFERATRERLQRLERAAASGYAEGQRSILELLDAEGARAAVEERSIDLRLLIKHAEILLRAAQGEFE